ncbi:MAG: apolipoprotein N-acyltransferase [Geobacteraceae bacterium]|nr:apolipoprotein N-acyltransferase [Geobacteraceae bacterium]
MDYSRFKMPDFNAIPRRDYLLAVISGLLLALSFPKTGIAALSWVALVPLLLACGHKTAGKAARLGFACGLACYGAILYWINIAVTTYGHLPVAVSIIVFTILVAYMAAYFAVLCSLMRLGEEKGIPAVLSLPFLWVCLEFVRSFLFTGFPWASLGYSQYRILPLIQIADITGVYGLSFLVVLCNVVVYLAIKGYVKSRGGKGEYPVRSGMVFVALAGLAFSYGYLRLSHPVPGVSMKVALIQGNINQSIKWDPEFRDATISIYEKLTRLASAGGVDLVVWPESAAPFFFQDGGAPSSRIEVLASEIHAPILFGSPAYDDMNGMRKLYNSAFLLSDEGKLLGRSDKIHLVPFGEYVPMAKVLPFVRKLVEGVGDFSPGERLAVLDQGKAYIGVLVCFEGIFPELSRKYARAGARLLVNITNDAWYGRSSAPYQHLSMAAFRAVENRMPLVRAANTGITALIDSNGHIVRETPLFKETYLVDRVVLGESVTLYARYGDVFAVLCVLVSLAMAGLVLRNHFAGRAFKRS